MYKSPPRPTPKSVPIFPELMPHLEASWEAAAPRAEYLIDRYRDAGGNLRTQMTRIVKRAGLTPWPRIFHNMRSSRQTELEEIFPSHVVCKWIGNSPQVARTHYLQMTDEHFPRANQSGAESDAHVAQNVSRHAHADSRTESHSENNNPLEQEEMQDPAKLCNNL